MDEKKLKSAISANIAYFRKRSGYTQQSLAEVLNSKQTTISSWERCQSLPDADTLFQLSRLFNCSLSDLYGVDTSSTGFNLSSEEMEIISAYRRADYVGREMVRRALGLQEKEAAASSVS